MKGLRQTPDLVPAQGMIMRYSLTTPLALTLGIVLASVGLGSGKEAAAQTQPAGASQGEVKQVALTDQQVDNFLAAKADMDAIAAKLSDQAADQPDAKVLASFDAAAKKHQLANYGEYVGIASSIGVVLAGVDPDTKTYVGPEAVIKKQIAEVQADKTLKPKDRKEALDELDGEIKGAVPVKVPGNIPVVIKHYDKLATASSDDK